jgi:hypothetical protein
MRPDPKPINWTPAEHPHLAQPGPEIVADHIRRTFLDPQTPLRLGGRQELIVLAVDGISWETLRRVSAHADVAIRYRSTFPSTSLVSWLTAVGVAREHHPVPGPVFALGPGATANLISDHSAAWTATTGTKPCLPADTTAVTVFEQLASHDITTEVLIGDFYGINESWISQLCRGATRVNPSSDLAAIRMSPGGMAEAMLTDLRRRLTATRAAIRWVYFNFDDHIHRTGYDSELLVALHHVTTAARRFADAGYTVLLHSDHGHIRNTTNDTDQTAWATTDHPGLCIAPAGGAGRVRWLYPKPGRTDEVTDRLQAAFDDRIAVLARDSLSWQELAHAYGNPSLLSPKVGDVIAVATGPDFPVPDPAYLFEHGSLCADEMNTGALAWLGT